MPRESFRHPYRVLLGLCLLAAVPIQWALLYKWLTPTRLVGLSCQVGFATILIVTGLTRSHPAGR
jgi:hypothetical protein